MGYAPVRKNQIMHQIDAPKRNLPILMSLDKPKPKPVEIKQPDLSGYESAQRKRFLRAEFEEEKQAEASARRALLKLECQI